MRVIDKTYEIGTLILSMMPEYDEYKNIQVFLLGKGMNESKQYYRCSDGFQIRIDNDDPYSKVVKVLIKSYNQVCYYNRFRIPPKIKSQNFHQGMIEDVEILEDWNIDSSIVLKNQMFSTEVLSKQALELLK